MELAMGALSRFEELVERLVEGTLIGMLGAEVQPVEMAKRLARAMESERAIGVGRAIAPNDYTVRLNPEDHERFAPVQEALERDLAEYLRDAARERGLRFLGQPTVRLEAAPGVGRHQIRVAARLATTSPRGEVAAPAPEHTQRFQAVQPGRAEPSAPAPRPVNAAAYQLAARADRARYPLRQPVITLGRALDNAVVLEDSRVSRYHAELRLVGGRYHLRDLRSTNGTYLNGRPVADEPVQPGDSISLGGLELLFQVEPRAEARDGR